MVRAFRSDDEGKKVMTADGDMVATVDKVQGDEIHVKPDSGLSQNTRRKLGWTKQGESAYPLEHSKIDDIKGDEIHLKRNL